MSHTGNSNPYDTLGIARTAPDEVVRAAWRALCKVHHPDRNPGNPVAAQRIAEINGAYETLSNPRTRAEYDNWLERNKGSGVLRRLAAPDPAPDRWRQTRRDRLALSATAALLLAVLAAIGTYADGGQGTVSETAWMRAAVDAAEGRAPPRSLPADPGTVLRTSATLSEVTPALRLAAGDEE